LDRWDALRGIATLPAAVACRLNVNGDTQNEAATDGVMLMRYLLGYRGSALTAGMTLNANRATPQAVEAFLASNNYDVSGSTTTSAHALRDGVVIMRYLQNATGNTMIAGTGIADTEAAAVRNRIVAWCNP
jgi:hypothetical protein